MLKDLTGQTFEKWTVESRAENSRAGAARWNCKCDCGKEKVICGRDLNYGSSTQCRNCASKQGYRGQPSVGSLNGRAKLDETKVAQIKAHLKIGVSAGWVAKAFKVARSTIDSIASGLSWSRVKPAEHLEPIRPERVLPIRLRDHRLEAALNSL